VIAATLAVIGFVVRFPFDGWPGALPFAKSLLYAAAVMAIFVSQSISRLGSSAGSFKSVLLPTIGLLLAPITSIPLGSAAGLVLSAAFSLAVWHASSTLREAAACSRRGEVAATTLLGAFVGIALFFNANSFGYASVFSLEQTLTGTQFVDTIYHATLANSVIGFGTVSTMLDGLPFTRYHFFSHLLLGSLAHWLSVTTIEAYYFGTQIALIPIFILTVIGCQLHIWATRIPPVMVVLTPLCLLSLGASFLISESFTLGLILLFVTAPLLVEWIDRGQPPALLDLVLALMVCFIAGLAKISVGLVMAAAVWGVCVRLAGIGIVNAIRYGVPAAVVVAAMSALGAAHSHNISNAFVPFHFIRQYGWDAVWTMLLVPPMGFLALRQMLGAAERRDRLIAEVFAFVGAVSVGAALCLKAEGGSAGYFSQVGNWFSVVYLAQAASSPHLTFFLDRRRWLATLAIAMVCLAATSADKRQSVQNFLAQFRTIQNAVQAQTGVTAGSTRQGLDLLYAVIAPGHPDRHALAAAMYWLPGPQLIRAVRETAAGAPARTAVYVPPDNLQYWTLFGPRQSELSCLTGPLFIPSMTGLPLIKGLSPAAWACPKETYWGYNVYGADARSDQLSDAELCDRATAKGFSHVIVLPSARAARRVACPR
jgi:hypothetical protein